MCIRQLKIACQEQWQQYNGRLYLRHLQVQLKNIFRWQLKSLVSRYFFFFFKKNHKMLVMMALFSKKIKRGRFRLIKIWRPLCITDFPSNSAPGCLSGPTCRPFPVNAAAGRGTPGLSPSGTAAEIENDRNCADKNDRNCADKRRKLHPPFLHLRQSRASW